MKKVIKASLVVAAVLSLSACSFGKDSKQASTTVVPNPGTVQKEAVSVDSNDCKWADYSAKLPRNFPEIKINGSSDFNNFISEMGIISMTWTNSTQKNMDEMISFLEGELDCKFEKDGDCKSAVGVELSGTKYTISISHSDGDPEMITMNIHVYSEPAATAE